MIYSFSCENFYSFCDKTTIDFRVDKNAPKNHGYFTTPLGTRLSKYEVVIGPNASGKTNLLKVLPFIGYLINDSFKETPDDQLPLLPFLMDGNKKINTQLSVVFELNKSIYTYTFLLNQARIEKETLTEKYKVAKNFTTKMLFSRIWDQEKQVYISDLENFELPDNFSSDSLIRNNCSIISAAARLNHPKSLEIATYWLRILPNVSESGHKNAEHKQLEMAFNFFNRFPESKNELERLLAKFDLGLDSIEIKEHETNDTTFLDIHAGHNFNGKRTLLPFEYESSGTQQFVALIAQILPVLTHGGIAVVDELDQKLHPEMVLSILTLFTDSSTNPKNAQLLFSTHAHLVLTKLDKQQIVLTDKNHNGSSEAWRLDEMGVRPDENLYAKYISGSYGATPKIT